MERTHWLTAWRGTVWEVRPDGCWRPLPRHAAGTWLVLTACNPRGRKFSATANHHRDDMLRRMLLAMSGERDANKHAMASIRHAMHSARCQRVRGRSSDGTWAEPGWMIPLRRRPDAHRWLQRFQQIAALVVDRHGWSLQWCDGVSGRWPG